MEKEQASEVASTVSQCGTPQAPAPAVSEVSAQASSSTNQRGSERSYWGFEGRITRREFWSRMAALVLGTLGMGILLPRVRTDGMGSIDVAILLVRLACLFFALWFGLATQVKRWHDVDRSGWMVLLNMVPGLGIIVVIVLGCLPGTVGANRYGIDPLSTARHSQDGGPSNPSVQS